MQPFYVAKAQQEVDSTQFKKYRNVLYGAGVLYAASLAGLSKIWYSEHDRDSFRFFNDNPEWYQMDKAGHFFSAFHISQSTNLLFQKAGMDSDKALLWSTLAGPVLLLPIEILDGFSKAYGASTGDFLANLSGSLFFMAQHQLWDQAYVKPKFSFQRSPMAVHRPEVLGYNLQEELIKDYNGQTYWLSFDLYSLTGIENFPKWLNIAVGHGIENVVHARKEVNASQGYNGYRQFYLALDFDLSHIKSRHSFINTLLYLVDLIHIPAPALEYNRKQGIKFHALQF